jgi:hypothetical protein
MNEPDFRGDRVMDALSTLATHEPDHGRAARVRTRCHAELQDRGRRSHVTALTPRIGWRHVLEPAIVGTLCAVYLFEVLSRALQLYQF